MYYFFNRIIESETYCENITYLADENLLREFKKLMVQSDIYGFDPDLRCMIIQKVEQHPTFREIIDDLKNLTEISEETYGVLTTIKKFDVIREAIKYLQDFIDVQEKTREKE